MIKDYLVRDEYGIDKVLCMNCGVTVAKRNYIDIPSKEDHTKKVRVAILKRLGNWRQVPMTIVEANGRRNSYIEAIVCADCLGKELDTKNILRMVVDGFCKERPDKAREIKKLYSKRKLVRE